MWSYGLPTAAPGPRREPPRGQSFAPADDEDDAGEDSGAEADGAEIDGAPASETYASDTPVSGTAAPDTGGDQD